MDVKVQYIYDMILAGPTAPTMEESLFLVPSNITNIEGISDVSFTGFNSTLLFGTVIT